ncbi:MAG: TonB-dependent receptor [Tannerellaceae bacterium]|jgi:TonB-linked SusC/RagA family outer membrane protein|nr:TonB-dependent receptor [Tannerellaceae bacterium]
MKKRMKGGMLFPVKLLVIMFLIIPFAGIWEANAKVGQQALKVEGTVVDEEGVPIIGANVIEVGATGNGSITDVDGFFSLSVSPAATLRVSYIGFISQDIAVNKRNKLAIILKADTQSLDEVVVVGFGTQKKVNLTGAVGVADAEAFKERPVMTAAQALQGMVPGLQIIQNSGNMEDRPAINIRGTATIGEGSSGSPLILVDGMAGDINAINPQDIESISVLKDAASSSIYGSRAPFGVILITTKKGKSGKATLNYNNNFHWSDPVLLPQWMDSYTFALYWNDANINSGTSPFFNDEHLKRIVDYQNGTLKASVPESTTNPGFWLDGYLHGNDNRDYYDVLYRSRVFSQEHNVSLNGGSDRFTYYTSMQFLDQNGLIEFNQDKYKRYTGTVKLNVQATDWAQFNTSTRFVREDYKRPSFVRDDLWAQIGYQAWPTLPLYDPNGYLYNTPSPPLKIRDGGDGVYQTDNVYLQAQLVLEPVKNWKTFAEFNYWIKNANTHWSIQKTYNHNVNGDMFLSNTSSNVHEEQLKDNYANTNLYSEYTCNTGGHTLKGLVGFQMEMSKSFKFSAQREGIIIPDLPELDLTSGIDNNGNAIVPTVGGSRNHWATAGFFGRINYDYKQKYLLEANIRYDGTSRYRAESRWAWLPSVSAGWNVAYEDFWQPLSEYMGSLKFRVSYGELGNQNTDSWYPTYQSMGVGSSNGSWLLNSAKPNTASAPGLVSSTLTWERVRTANAGLDFGALNNRLTGSFDYFNRYTLDMIGPAPELPVTLGTSVPKTNNTDLKTYGFEFSLGWNDRLKNGLGYSVKAILSDSQTEITRYPNETGRLGTYRKGMKVGEIWGYTTGGIAKTTEEMDAHLASLPNGGQNALGNLWRAGDIMYKDTNGDGAVNNGANTIYDHGDLKIIGNNSPRYHFGLDLSADYKGFDIRAFFQGVLKRDYYNGGYFFYGASGSGIWVSVGFKPHEDYFRDDPEHPLGLNLDSYFARPYFNSKNQQVQTRYLQDASYARLKNLQLGYTLPQAVTRKFAVSNLRFFVSGENLFTFTNMFKVFDPETVDGGYSGTHKGSGYPLMKVLSLGLSINF